MCTNAQLMYYVTFTPHINFDLKWVLFFILYMYVNIYFSPNKMQSLIVHSLLTLIEPLFSSFKNVLVVQDCTRLVAR